MAGFNVEQINGIINDIFYPHYDRKLCGVCLLCFFVLILGEISVSDTTTKSFK